MPDDDPKSGPSNSQPAAHFSRPPELPPAASVIAAYVPGLASSTTEQMFGCGRPRADRAIEGAFRSRCVSTAKINQTAHRSADDAAGLCP